MPISNERLLEGIAQALRVLEASTTDPVARGLAQGAAFAVDELFAREDTAAIAARYAAGRSLLEQLLATWTWLDPDTLGAVHALPAAIDAGASWRSASACLERLLQLAVTLGAQGIAHGAATTVMADLRQLFAWEAEGYAFRRREVASLTAAAPIAADAVETFIRSAADGREDARIVAFQPLRGGFSKQTILFEIDSSGFGREPLVLRADGPVKVLGLRGQEIAREFHLLRYVHAGGIRCAEALWLNAGASPPYFISRQLPGRNIGDGVSGNEAISDAVARSLAEAIAAIHRLPVEQSHPDVAASHLAAPGPLTRTAAQRAYLEEWVAVWRRAGRTSPITETAIRWALDNVPVDARPAALVHSDCGFNNLLVHEDRVSAVLDWELTHLGDPAEDVSWLMYQIKQADMRERFLAHFCAAGGESFEAFRLAYYDVMASLRMLIAMADIGEKFQSTPQATAHFCAYALPHLQGPATAIMAQIEAAEHLR